MLMRVTGQRWLLPIMDVEIVIYSINGLTREANLPNAALA